MNFSFKRFYDSTTAHLRNLLRQVITTSKGGVILDLRTADVCATVVVKVFQIQAALNWPNKNLNLVKITDL